MRIGQSSYEHIYFMPDSGHYFDFVSFDGKFDACELWIRFENCFLNQVNSFFQSISFDFVLVGH